MYATLAGPMETQQINKQYFVGYGDLLNIQTAVNTAKTNGAPAEVIIPSDYQGSDAIDAVTNGDPSVYIIDQRGGPRRPYFWYPAQNKYIAEPLQWNAGISTQDFNSYLYVGWGAFNTIQSAVNFAVSIAQYAFSVIVITPRYTGSEIIEDLINGTPQSYIADQRTDEWQNYFWNGTNYEASPSHGMVYPPAGIAVSDGNSWEASIDPATLATQTDLGDYLPLEGGTLTGKLTLHADPIGALEAATKQYVDSHGGGGGTTSGIWKRIGQVIVPAGGQANIVFNNIPQTHTNLKLSFNAKSSDSANSASVVMQFNGDGGPNYDATIIYNSTTTPQAANANNSTSMGLGNVAAGGMGPQAIGAGEATIYNYTDTLTNTWIDAKAGVMQGTWVQMVLSSGHWRNAAAVTDILLALSGGIFVEGSVITLYGDNGTAGGGGGGGMEWPPEGVPVSSGSSWSDSIDPADLPRLSAASNTFAGGMTLGANTTINGEVQVVASGQSCKFHMTNTAAPANNRSWLQETFSNNQLRWRTIDDTGSTDFVYMQITRNDVYVPNIDFFTTTVTVHGDFNASGAKNFRIIDPRDPKKYIYHSCLEGPEHGVYYRGEAVTFDGRAEIVLPDYFEVLTADQDRSVLVTEIDDGTDTFSQFKVSQVKDGKFTVRSSVNSARFHWQVNAIRRDLQPLEVNPTIPDNESTIEGQ